MMLWHLPITMLCPSNHLWSFQFQFASVQTLNLLIKLNKLIFPNLNTCPTGPTIEIMIVQHSNILAHCSSLIDKTHVYHADIE